MARSNHSFARGRSGRSTSRRPSWSNGPGGIFSRTATGQSLLTGQAQANLTELTIIRLRGIFNVFLTSGTASLDGYDGACGICVVSENAAAAGVAAVPSPVTDVAWDGWFWHQFFSLKVLTTTFADGVNGAAAQAKFEVDSKAMRKMNITDVIIAVLEATEVGTA